MANFQEFLETNTLFNEHPVCLFINDAKKLLNLPEKEFFYYKKLTSIMFFFTLEFVFLLSQYRTSSGQKVSHSIYFHYQKIHVLTFLCNIYFKNVDFDNRQISKMK